ncbi:MAG: hypothetical protein ABJA66_06720 [Actinomycetota bacterium]
MFKKLVFGLFIFSTFGCLSAAHAQSKERLPKLPDNLARFENEYPMDLFKNAAVKAQLRKLLGRSYNDFMEAIDSQEPLEKTGDLLIGKGCAKGLCKIYEAMIVIDLAGKTIYCGIVNTGLKTKYRKFSESPSSIPPVLRNWASELLKDEN